jgi:iron complex outermembrane recepter protein
MNHQSNPRLTTPSDLPQYTHTPAPKASPKSLSLLITSLIATSCISMAHAQNMEEITVTGTRIRMTDGMSTPVPVTSVTTAELQSFEPGGTIAEQLDALPQFFGTQTAQRGGNWVLSGGGSYLNMRNLGSNRTLVLLDGSRVAPADKSGNVNVDTLPTALMRSIDVVTGGASAAYGADAMGGVTNFVLDREFTGLKFEAGTGINEWGDGPRWNMSLAGGRAFGDRMHVIGSVQALEIKEIRRLPEDLGDWFQRWGWVTNPDWVSATATPNVPQRLTLPWVTSSEHSPTGVIWARRGNNSTSPMIPFALNGMTFTEDGRDVRQFIHGDVYAAPWRSGSTKSMAGGPEAQIHNRAFNGGPFGANAINRNAFTAVKYDFSDTFTGFAQILVGRSESMQNDIRGNLALRDGWFATVFRDNAFLPEHVGRAMDDAGITSFQLHKGGYFVGNNDTGEGSLQRTVFTTYSWSTGFDADFSNGWHLRASWQSGRSDKRTGIYDEIRIDRAFLSMDAVRHPQTGAIVCNVQLYNPTPAQLAASVAGRLASPGGTPGGPASNPVTDPLLSPIGLDNSIRDCVPWNVMGAGNMSKAAQEYTMTPKIGKSYVDQDFAEVLLTGELFQGWQGPISFAAGLTWREQSFVDGAYPVHVDVLGPPLNAPQLGIRGIPAGYTTGSANLHQFSTLPNIFGAYNVWEAFSELNIPIWESSSGAQSVNGSAAYRHSEYNSIGGIESWKLGLDVQIFEDLRLRMTKSRDVREASFSERFDAQAVGGGVFDPRFGGTAFQITQVTGGNPDLRPEQANTHVVGLVYQPNFIDGLRMSVDWYDVKISDAVGTLGSQRIVDECESGVAPSLCAQIQRDPATGFIGRIFNVPLNVALSRVNGIDYELSYRTEPNFFNDQRESFTLRFLGGYVRERSNTPFGASFGLNTAGTVGTPDFTGNITGNYSIGPYSIQLQQRHIPRAIMNPNWVEGVHVDINTIASGNYTNMQLAYNGETQSGGTWRVSFNITNLFDRHPPVQPSFNTAGGAQSVSNNYDVFGRRYQVNFNMNL